MAHNLKGLQDALVRLGTTKIAHLDVDLMTHMTIVYDTLKRWGRPEDVMLAGLFHGIYGTHALQATQVFELSEDRRAEVRSLIGESAERLVYYFCVMTYESLGKSVRNLMRPGGKPELWDRCANRSLNVTKEEFHDVLWLKFADLLAHVPQLPPETKRSVTADYGPFWQLVAKYLGDAAVNGWNEVFGDSMKIRPSEPTPAH